MLDVPAPDETERVIAFWRRLGLPGLIDVHTHFMPKRVMDKVWAYFDQVGPLTGRPWPIAYRADEDARLEQLRGFGVRAFTSMVYPHKPEMAAWLNTWAADFAARSPDCLRTATFFPEPEAKRYVADAIESGTRVFKAHLQVGAYDPRDPALNPVWGALQDSGVPVVVHCGSGPYPGAFTGPGPIGAVLERFPRLRLIVAHLGLPEYAEFLDLAATYDGLLLDTTMVFTDFTEQLAPFPPREFPRLRDLQDRILLGTDFPNIPYPYLHQLESLARLELGDDWLRAVCHHNATHLFDL
jgi:predicted TIM-barrel fold metal-dependent hydrolase